MLRSLAALLLLSTAAPADTADGEALKAMTWDQVVEEARGGTVNWFMWGGADTINCVNGGNDTNVADAADTVNGDC